VDAVEVLRGGLVEARHAVHAVVADTDGRLLAAVGDPSLRTSYRSAAKPFQALPLVEEGVVESLGLTEAELALCCASHQGEPAHVEGARSILTKAGLDESVLRCGPHAPFAPSEAEALARRGQVPRPIHNNCSGKHAGMAALAVAMGWSPEDYHRPGHPVQRRMLAEVLRWSELPEADVEVGIDGCGVPCFGLPLRDMAASFARFSAAAAEGGPPGRIVGAMTSHPFMVAGTGRVCTDAMVQAEGRAFLKLGAEGLYCGGVPEEGWGFAVKIGDGARRAVDVAVIRVLEGVGALDDRGVEALSHHGRPPVLNTRGETVGEIRAAFRLEMAGA
jgi:L-asparaginase II